MTDEEAQAVAQAQQLLDAWDETANLLGAWSAQCADMSAALFGGYHGDDYVRGMLVGEGYAWDRAARALAHVGNAMRMVKAAADAGVESD